MSNYQMSQIVTVNAQNAPSWVLCAISAFPIIAAYDEMMMANAPYLVYQTHMAAHPAHKQIRPIRGFLYGEGLITGGFCILSADKQRREASQAFTDTTNDGDLLVQQDFTGTVVGHQFDLTFFLSGTGLVIREAVLEYEEVQ